MSKVKSYLVGVDEVGRGSWAGPLVAAAVVVHTPDLFPFDAVRDSKLLSDRIRRQLFSLIQESCTVRFGIVSNRLIDQIGLQAANVLAVDQALQAFHHKRYQIHCDYIARFKQLTSLAVPVRLHVNGEDRVPEIAAASIMAKVYRDNLMIALSSSYRRYALHKHKGYGTRLHRALLERFGVSPIHRRSFKPVQKNNIRLRQRALQK